MADMMNFPKRWEDFLHDYEFEDARRIYTNGASLIQSFSVKHMVEYYACGEKRLFEPLPDGIQFRTVDDLGRICIPKDIMDKLGIKPGTECAVYSTDELTPDEIIVIRRNKNEKTP